MSLQKQIYQSIQKQHPDVTYFKKEEIALILSKGLATTCREQPRNPIEYFGNWLMEYNKVQKVEKEKKEKQKDVDKLVKKHQFYLKSEQAQAAESKRKEDARYEKRQSFWNNLYKSEDPYDNLEEFSVFLHENTNATGAYIGKLEHPFQEIAEDADENAHLNMDQPEIIKFLFSNLDHRSKVVGTTLKPGQGITHGVFTDEFTTQNEQIDVHPEGAEKADYSDICDQYKHIFVDEVVREPKMHYWNVPRLGSYMAVPMVYKSSLNVASFQKAYEDMVTYKEAVAKQMEEKADHEANQTALKADADAAGTEFVPEERTWDEIILPPIETVDKKFVICLDTMGQDRVFCDKEKSFILKSIHRYRCHWENFEKEKVAQDRDALIAEKEKDSEIINEEFITAQQEKEEALVKAKIDPEQEEGAEKKSDDEAEELTLEQKQYFQTTIKMQFNLDLLTKEEPYKARFHSLVGRKVVKLQSFIKAFFYLLEIKSEDICEDNTQKLFWKKAKNQWNDKLLEKMQNYVFQGPKTNDIKAYQTLNLIERVVKDMSYDEICLYNQALGVVHRWMILAIDARKRDVASRLNESKKKREEREEKIEQEKERKEKRDEAFEAAKGKHNDDNADAIERYNAMLAAEEAGEEFELDEGEEKPTKDCLFDEKYFLFQYDEDQPEIVIPPEVIDDTNNDWIIADDVKAEVIEEYLTGQQEADIFFHGEPAPPGKKK